MANLFFSNVRYGTPLKSVVRVRVQFDSHTLLLKSGLTGFAPLTAFSTGTPIGVTGLERFRPGAIPRPHRAPNAEERGSG